jgi:hypothetical protein
VTDADEIGIEMSAHTKLFGSENCAGYEFREGMAIKKLRPGNGVRKASQEMSG